MSKKKLLQSLPQVGEMLTDPRLAIPAELLGHERLTEIIRQEIDAIRQGILDWEIRSKEAVETEAIVRAVVRRCTALSGESQIPVINATGVILHTSLGRAVLASESWDFASKIASGYSLLELQRSDGKRGDRDQHINELAASLCGAESATVVNNNAAATMLILNELAFGKETIISRAQQVEIGGSYRMPDVMEKSGTRMVEVGTTNKCYLTDYANAITDNTGCLLKVHTSNYAISGFTHYASISDLAELGKEHDVPAVYDLGAGSLVDLEPYGLHDEPTVPQLVKDGADLVCFSGDKLLGGPQAGIIVGRKDLIQRLKQNQMFRMLRCDKVTLALLEATLRIYLQPNQALKDVPTLRMISESAENVHERAMELYSLLSDSDHLRAEFVEHHAYIGGGSLPTEQLPSYAIALTSDNYDCEALARRLRDRDPCVFARVSQDRVLLDARTTQPGQVQALARAVLAVVE